MAVCTPGKCCATESHLQPGPVAWVAIKKHFFLTKNRHQKQPAATTLVSGAVFKVLAVEYRSQHTHFYWAVFFPGTALPLCALQSGPLTCIGIYSENNWTRAGGMYET